MKSPKDAAKEILQQLQHLFQGSDIVATAVEQDFPHLDFARYSKTETQFRERGFHKLADVELVNISQAPYAIYQRTLVRCMASTTGEIVCSFYQFRPRWRRILTLLLQALLALRPIAGLRLLLAAGPARFIIDLESELDDGSFVVTSSAKGAAMLSGPEAVDERYFPYNTSLDELLTSHHVRLAEALQKESPVAIRKVYTQAQNRQLQDRLKALKNAHRMAQSWVNEHELNTLSSHQKTLSKAVFAELQLLLQEQQAEQEKRNNKDYNS